MLEDGRGKKKSKKKIEKKKSVGPKLYFPARTPTPLDNYLGNYYHQAREWVEMEHAHWSERVRYQTHVIRSCAWIYIKDNNSLGTIGEKASGVAGEEIFYLIENKGDKLVVSLPILMLCSLQYPQLILKIIFRKRQNMTTQDKMINTTTTTTVTLYTCENRSTAKHRYDAQRWDELAQLDAQGVTTSCESALVLDVHYLVTPEEIEAIFASL